LDGILIHTNGFGETISIIFSLLRRSSVIGPGISFSIIFFSIGFEIIQYLGISLLCHKCTIKGLFDGLFLSSKIFETAWISKAFAHSQ
jgi:hypothetical protein